MGQAVTSRVAATFSEAIQPSSVTFVLVDSSSSTVPATVSYDPSSYSVTLTPNAYLSTSQTYTATLSGATDLAGNVMTGSLIWSFSTGSMSVGARTVDANGVESYSVTSVFQGPQSMTVRVLEPTSPAPGQPHRLLYVLPVEIGVTSLSSAYSDGLEQLRLLGIPNQFNMTLIAPSFNYMPWYGDNITNSQYLMESFVINDLMPFGDTFAKGTEILPRLAIGFSKSGNGVLFLILRHPNVFSAVAAWDSPAQLNSLNTFAPDLQTNFGTQANFNLYNIPSLVASGAAPFTQQNRLWVSGDQGLYTPDMELLHNELSTAFIPHTFVEGGPRVHSWASGWLQGAVTALDAVSIVRSNGQPSGMLPSGVAQTSISLNTDQKATCRFASSAGIPYASMPYPFATTGGTSHSTPVTGLINGGIYSFFVRCQDSLGNSNPEDFSIVFSVANPGDATPPARSNGQPTGVLAAGTTQTNLSLATDEDAICRYATAAGTAYASMVNTFSSTGGTAHSTVVNGLVSGGNYKYYVRCEDASGNTNPDDFVINFFTVSSDPASSGFVGVESPLSEGGMWSTSGSWGSMSKNNGAYGPGTDLARLANPVVSADQFSEITFDQNLGSTSWVGVTTRVQGAGNGSSYLAIAYNGQVLLFRTDDNGGLSWTQLAGASVDITAAPRDLRLESQGANHRVYFNGVQLINYTASGTVYMTGQPGIAVYENASTAEILTFTGGSLGGSAPPRTTPPVRSNGEPAGVLVGATQANLSLFTDENATCSYATVAGTAYASMVNVFTTTGGTAHSTPVSGLSIGGTYNYYVRCQDDSGNTNPDDFVISFSVGVAGSDPESSGFVGVESPLSEGGMWSMSGSWGSMSKNNGAYGPGTDMARLATPMVSADQFSEITFDQNLGSTSWVGVITRVQGAGNGSSYLAIAYNGGVQLFRVDDSGGLNWTQLAAANVDITAAPRDLRLESQGANHRVYFNGVQLINYTESAPVYTTGQPGVAVYENASTAKILTFTGGSLSGSGSGSGSGSPRTTPPVRSNGEPAGVLVGATQANLSLFTDENATCSYATVAGTAYASMVNVFTTTGGTTHSTGVSGLVSGTTYNYYVRCQDSSGNTNPDDYAITFTVGVAGSDPASSSFIGVESPLSEGGMWNKPGAWGSMSKNNGAYGSATNMAGLANPVVSADQFSEITFDQNLGSTSWVGVTTRVQSASNGSCYLAIAYNGQVLLFRTDDTGSLNWTQLAGASVDITAAPRDLRLESQGANHRVYFNGVQLINYTESAPVYTTGQPGVAVYENASTAKILTFTGGSLSGSGSGSGSPRTTPPVRSNGEPAGVLVGATQANLSLATDENATCRYATVAGTAYASMVNTFSTTGGTAHSTGISGLVGGATYSYYVRCQDGSGNINPDDYAITFTVGVVGSDPASSSFIGVESPLSEGGMWNKPGAWGSMSKNNGAYGSATNMAGLANPVVSADQFSEITFDQNLGSTSWVGVTTRVQSASNGSCYLAIAYNGQVLLFRTDDTGSLNWTQLAGASVDITAAPRDLRLESQGANHRVYFNGVQLINYTESVAVYTTGQPGVAVYENASTAKILTFTGGSLSGSTTPGISSANSATFTAGTAGSFAITTTGTPTPSLAETGTLPSGVTFQYDGNGTATLSGTPSSGSGGTYSLTITASNGVGTNASQSFTLAVNLP